MKAGGSKRYMFRRHAKDHCLTRPLCPLFSCQFHVNVSEMEIHEAAAFKHCICLSTLTGFLLTDLVLCETVVASLGVSCYQVLIAWHRRSIVHRIRTTISHVQIRDQVSFV